MLLLKMRFVCFAYRTRRTRFFAVVDRCQARQVERRNACGGVQQRQPNGYRSDVHGVGQLNGRRRTQSGRIDLDATEPTQTAMTVRVPEPCARGTCKMEFRRKTQRRRPLRKPYDNGGSR